MRLSPELLLDGLVFPEGPRWFDGRLWLSDMHAHRVITVTLDGKSSRVVEFHDDTPSGLGFLADGTPLVVSRAKRLVLRIEPGGELATYADISDLPGSGLNDMVVDGDQRIYLDNRFPRQGSPDSLIPDSYSPQEGLILVDRNGVDRVVAVGLQSPNGLSVTADGRRLIVAETWVGRLTTFAIEPDGGLSHRRIFAHLPNSTPDGICLDAEGAVWIGSVLSGVFQRVLEGGRVTHEIRFPTGTWAIACALGGPYRRTLFMLTAVTTIANQIMCRDFESAKSSTSKARVSAIDVDVPGAGWP